MEQIRESIHRALDAGRYINTQLVGHLPYVWKFAEVRFSGMISKAAEIGLFDEVIIGLINIEDGEQGMTFNRIGGLLGFTVENEQKLRADIAEIEILTNAISHLVEEGLISGDENGYFLTGTGRILVEEGWRAVKEDMPSFRIFIDSLEHNNIEDKQIFERWSLRNKKGRTEILSESLKGRNVSFEIEDNKLQLVERVSDEEQAILGIQYLGVQDGDFPHVYTINEAPYSYKEFTDKLVGNIELLREYTYKHDPKAHYPEEKRILLADPMPTLLDITEYGYEVQVCLLSDPSKDSVQIQVFDPVTNRFSKYLTDTLRLNDDCVKDILQIWIKNNQEWIKDNPELAEKINLVSNDKRDTEIKQKFKAIQAEATNKMKNALGEEEQDAIYDEINSGRKAFDEYMFEQELAWLFNMVEQELWLNFPRLGNQPLKIRPEQIEKALKRGVNVFLGYSSEYFNVDKMHGDNAFAIYSRLDKEYPNFFMCEIGLQHKRTILAKSSDKLAFEYIPSYNIMSFAPYDIEEEIAKEINYRVPWDTESEKEYEYLKKVFVDTYKKRFSEFMENFSYQHDYSINAKTNYERIEKEVRNLAYWAEALNNSKKEISDEVNKFLVSNIHNIIQIELDTLERQLTDNKMTSHDGKLPPKEAIGRIFSLEAWIKKLNSYPKNTLHRCKVIRAGYYDTYPELKTKKGSSNNKGGGKKHHNKKNRRK